MRTFQEEILLRMLEARGVTIDRDGNMVRIAGFNGPNPMTDAQIRYYNERQGEHETEGILRRNWVDQLAELAEQVHREGEAVAWPSRGMFWIRLHGVLHDERQRVLRFFNTIGIDPATYRPNAGSDLDLALAEYRAIEGIRTVFTEDELIYADYLRQTNGHPTQAQYSVRWSDANGGQVNDRRRISTVGREFTTAELDAAVRRVLMAHLVNGRPNEYRIAAVFAGRVREVIGPLVDIKRRLNMPAR